MLYGLDICAGSWIGSAAFEATGFCRTVCYVERDEYCQRLLRQRMLDGWLQPAPIWDDIKTFDGRPWRGLVDFLFGGIPCQPHSIAGKRAGGSDERDLWPDFWRVVCEVGPGVVLVENVPGLLSSDGGAMFGSILGDLAAGGYDAEWDCIPAAAVGAPHRRDRVWLVAYARSAPDGQQHSHEGERRDLPQPDPQLANADSRRRASAEHDAGGDREGGPEGADGAPGSESAMADPQVQSIWSGLCTSEQAGQRGRRPCDGGSEGALPVTIGQRLEKWEGLAGDAGAQQPAVERGGDAAGPAGWWELGPDVDRVADGVAARVDRLRTIGNGWVPQVAAVVAGRIGRRLLR